LASLRSNHFLGAAEIAPDLAELSWWDERGKELAPEDWDNQEARALVLRRALRKPDGRIELTALLMNGGREAIAFALPGDFPWKRLLDTRDSALDGAPAHPPYLVADRCAVLLMCEIEG
jgi:glycogen operon protein